MAGREVGWGRGRREIVLPDIERIVGNAEGRLRDEMQTGFDALAQRLDRLELSSRSWWS